MLVDAQTVTLQQPDYSLVAKSFSSMRNLLYLFTQFRFILLGAYVSMSAPGQTHGNAGFALTNSHRFKRRHNGSFLRGGQYFFESAIL